MTATTSAVSPQPDEAPPPEAEVAAIELRHEWQRLRKIMYENARVHLSTSIADGGRWLTDEYVCLDVTDSIAVEGVEDGAYKLMLSKGLVRIDLKHPDAGEQPCISGFDADAYFKILADADWQYAAPSEWSVAEHPGKAMLFSVHGTPALMGEETWATLRKQFDGMYAEYATQLNLNVFRVIWQDGTAPEGVVVAYVAGIRVPEGQEEIAAAIARMTA